MQQGHEGLRDRRSGSRSGIARRIGISVVGVAVLVSAGLVTADGTTPAGALTSRPPVIVVATPGGPTTTTTTVVSPTTTVVTKTGPTSVTTATTTVTRAPTSVTSTTVTSVTPTTTVPRATTTTTTTVPRATTTTTVPRATTTTTTTVPVPRPTVPVTAPAGAPSTPTFNTNCSAPATPALQAYLDALPVGAVFRSSATACFEVTNGIVLHKPISIVGGTFYDPSTARPAAGGLNPIILIQDASQVTISGVSVLGANALGNYRPLLVGEAGVKLESATNVTLTGVTAKNTFGDGLELVADLGHRIKNPVSGLTVDGYTTVDAGRQGVTIAEVSGATLNHVNVVSSADSGFDFESDIPGLGAGNVSISNCTTDRGINFVETLTGPITISNCTGFRSLHLYNITTPAQVNVVGGLMDCRRRSPVPCITQTGGWLTLTGVAVQRIAGQSTISEPMWSVTSGGRLRIVKSQLEMGFGSVATRGTVNLVP